MQMKNVKFLHNLRVKWSNISTTLKRLIKRERYRFEQTSMRADQGSRLRKGDEWYSKEVK